VKLFFLTGTLLLCPLMTGTMMAQAAQAEPVPPAASKPAGQLPGQPAAPPQIPAPSKPQAPAQAPAPAPAPASAPAAKLGFEELESVWSVSLFYWQPTGKPILRGGEASTDPNSQGLDFPGKPKGTPGVMFTFPTGRSNRIEISGFQTSGSGSSTAPINVTYFGQGFTSGDVLASSYKIRAIKATWNYLSYPYPPLDAKFRIKTLWEVQYVRAYPVITGPQVDLSVPPPVASSTFNVILPTLGLGVELIPSPKHFRFEARATGMAFPGRAALWDADAMATFRLGKLEVFGGGKAFYFRSSPKKEQFMRDRLWGPIGGVRWVFR
jgi:hypothetical protein